MQGIEQGACHEATGAHTATDQYLQSEEIGLVSPPQCPSHGVMAPVAPVCQLHGKENNPV